MTASLQIYSTTIVSPVILISIMHEPLMLNNHYLVQPNMINYVFLQHIQSCSHELSHHTSLCHAHSAFLLFHDSCTTMSCFALPHTSCTDSLCHDFFPAKLHFVIHNHTMLLSSGTIMQCFIRSCTYYPAMNSIMHHPAMIYSCNDSFCHAPSCNAPFCHALSRKKLLFCHAPPFSCATLPRSWLNLPPSALILRGPYSGPTQRHPKVFSVSSPLPPPPVRQ